MKNVIITGFRGLIGSACVEKFLHEDWAVTAVDNFVRATLLLIVGLYLKPWEEM